MTAPQPIDLLIRADYLYPMTGDDPIVAPGEVAIRGDRIVHAGAPQPSGHWEAARVFDRPGRAVLPGLIDTHTHAASLVFRSQTDDHDVGRALYGVAFPTERDMTDEEWWLLARLGCCDLLRSGVTTLCKTADRPAKSTTRATLSSCFSKTPSTMIDTSTYLMYIAASAAIIIVPGPTVTVIIANSLRAGTPAGLMNVVGTRAGLALMIAVLAGGLTTIVAAMGTVFDIIRLLGAAYLIRLGIKLWRSSGALADMPANGEQPKGAGRYFWQGFLVIWSNPKALFFFGAFIPRFIDPSQDAWPQVLILGATFMAVATLLDGTYALAAGKTRALLSRGKLRLLERVSGSCLIGGGLWLALERR